MHALRLAAGPLLLLLALVVGGERADLLPCADADCGVWSTLLGTGTPGDDAPGDDAPGDAPPELPGDPSACLCHAPSVAPAAAPRAPHGTEGEGDYDAPPPVRPASGVARVPHPPPRG